MVMVVLVVSGGSLIALIAALVVCVGILHSADAARLPKQVDPPNCARVVRVGAAAAAAAACVAGIVAAAAVVVGVVFAC